MYRSNTHFVKSVRIRSYSGPHTDSFYAVTFGENRLIDQFYQVDYENENVQVPENNNSSDKESDKKVSDFLSSENPFDE